MTTHVEELRAELARAQAEGRELRAKLAIAEGERDRLQRACDEGLPREVILCPACGQKHLEWFRHDAPGIDGRKRPHHTHRCYHCEHVWDSERWSFGVEVSTGIAAERDAALAQAEELTRALRSAQRERDEARADLKSERGFAEGRRQQRNEAAELLTRRLEADGEPLTWGNVAWDSQRPDVLTLTLAAADGSERRAFIPREKVPLIALAAEVAGWKPTGKKVRRG